MISNHKSKMKFPRNIFYLGDEDHSNGVFDHAATVCKCAFLPSLKRRHRIMFSLTGYKVCCIYLGAQFFPVVKYIWPKSHLIKDELLLSVCTCYLSVGFWL